MIQSIALAFTVKSADLNPVKLGILEQHTSSKHQMSESLLKERCSGTFVETLQYKNNC